MGGEPKVKGVALDRGERDGLEAVSPIVRREERREVHALVLPTYNLSRAYWWAHSSDGPNPSHHLDCTHWCLPGVPDLWVAKLVSELLARLSPAKG